LGIILSVALFVTTTFNGERAEKTLVNFSLGYFGDKYHAKVKNLNDRIGIDDSVIEKIFYDEGLRFIDSIHPRIQKSVTVIGGSESVSAVYQGIDFVKEASDFRSQVKSCETPACKNGETNTFISSALYEKIGKTSFSFVQEGKTHFVKDAQVLETDGGIFILEDLTFAKERFGAVNYSFLLFIMPTLNSNNLTLLKSRLHLLHPSLDIETVDEIRARAANVLKSFHLNLIIISMISVLIAFFMVSNTMSGIFINRKRELGILRCLGTTRGENLFLFLMQSLILGVLGTFFGILLGAFFSKYSFFTGESTLTDMNQSISYSRIPMKIILASSVIGILGSLFSGLFPAIRSSRLQPITIVREDPNLIQSINFKLLFYFGIGIIVIAYILSTVKVNFSVPVFGLLAIGMIILGQTLCFPHLMKLFLNCVNWTLHRMDHAFIEIRIGFEEIVQNATKNTLTSATLMLGVSLIISLSVLTGSYEKSIVDWTEREFPFDYSIINMSDLETGTDYGIPLSLPEKISSLENIEEVDVFILNTKAEVGDKIFTIHAYDMKLARAREERKGISTYPDLDYNKDILVSANMAYLNGLKIGDTLKINSNVGSKELKIAGTREHFFSENGTIMMDYRLFKILFGIDSYRAVRVNVLDKFRQKETFEKLKSAISFDPNLKLINSQELKEIYIGGVKKVFKVLESLKYTAAIIAFVSLFSSILYNLGDKLRIFGVIRSIGSSQYQLNKIILAENFFLTFFGTIMGILSSFLLSPIIIHVINKTAFGWTLSVEIPYFLIVFCILSIPLVSLLATFYPFFMLKKLSLREILSYE
jgi:putative ABC transport system permease protein